MRQALFAVTIENDLRDARPHALLKVVTQLPRVLTTFAHLHLRQLGRGAETHDIRDRLSPGAPFAFLMAANLLRGQAHAPPDEQRAGSFWTIEFVGRERQEIAAKRLHIDRDAARRLHRVRVQPKTTMTALAF